MSHCPYSSDLLLNDFFLFPYVKQKMLGQRFSSPQEAVDAFQNHISEILISEWKNCFIALGSICLEELYNFHRFKPIIESVSPF